MYEFNLPLNFLISIIEGFLDMNAVSVGIFICMERPLAIGAQFERGNLGFI